MWNEDTKINQRKTHHSPHTWVLVRRQFPWCRSKVQRRRDTIFGLYRIWRRSAFSGHRRLYNCKISVNSILFNWKCKSETYWRVYLSKFSIVSPGLLHVNSCSQLDTCQMNPVVHAHIVFALLYFSAQRPKTESEKWDCEQSNEQQISADVFDPQKRPILKTHRQKELRRSINVAGIYFGEGTPCSLWMDQIEDQRSKIKSEINSLTLIRIQYPRFDLYISCFISSCHTVCRCLFKRNC